MKNRKIFCKPDPRSRQCDSRGSIYTGGGKYPRSRASWNADGRLSGCSRIGRWTVCHGYRSEMSSFVKLALIFPVEARPAGGRVVGNVVVR